MTDGMSAPIDGTEVEGGKVVAMIDANDICVLVTMNLLTTLALQYSQQYD
jgi:hypothetical protein